MADVVVSVIGVVLLLEAARRAVGPALAIIASIMLLYIFAGPWLPGMMGHQAVMLARDRVRQMCAHLGRHFRRRAWRLDQCRLLLCVVRQSSEKAGAGNYFIQLAFAMLGTYRGGPAKAGVVASGMTGMISGSSIANTVMTARSPFR